MDKILVDQEGYKQFYDELTKMKEALTNNASKGGEAYKDAVGDGWHDNFAYETAMAEERRINAKIKKMCDEEKKLEIVKIPPYDNDKVNINDVVKVKIIYSLDDSEEELIKLTGKYIPNNDSTEKEVSLNSPLGKAIYLKKINSIVSYMVGDNEIKVQIICKM